MAMEKQTKKQVKTPAQEILNERIQDLWGKNKRDYGLWEIRNMRSHRMTQNYMGKVEE